MTKRIVSGIFILTALGSLGVILAGALTSGEQLIVRFLTAVIVAALGLYVISDLRLQADDQASNRRARSGPAPFSAIGALPANSTAAFMATVTASNSLNELGVGKEQSDNQSNKLDKAPAAEVINDDGEIHVSQNASAETDTDEFAGSEPELVGSAITVEQMNGAGSTENGEIPDLVLAISNGTKPFSFLASNTVGYDPSSNGASANGLVINLEDAVDLDLPPTDEQPVISITTDQDKVFDVADSSTISADRDATAGSPWAEDVDVNIQLDSEDLANPDLQNADTGNVGLVSPEINQTNSDETSSSEAASSSNGQLSEHAWPVSATYIPNGTDSTNTETSVTPDNGVVDLPDIDTIPISQADEGHDASVDVLAAGQQIEAADYVDAPLAPIIDLREVHSFQTAGNVDNAIRAGEIEVISTLIEQGMLSTDGAISDRDVRTMVYVAFTSNELRKLLLAGGTPDGPNQGLDLGPVELFDETIHTPAPKTLYQGHVTHGSPKLNGGSTQSQLPAAADDEPQRQLG